MAKWYFQIDGEQFGPVDPAFLKRIAASGRLKPQDKVRREDSKDWHLAKQIQGLFNAGQNQSPSPPPTSVAITKQLLQRPRPPVRQLAQLNGTTLLMAKKSGR
jgi:hypothetical protein